MRQNNSVQAEKISETILLIRGEKVILDITIAQLYQVETRTLKQAVKRNRKSFPPDFLFILNNREIEYLVSQNVIPSKSHFGGAKPYAFTEQGVAMLSSVLKSDKAREINIKIMRAFVRMRSVLYSHRELAAKLTELEKKSNKTNQELAYLFQTLQQLINKPKRPMRKIGYKRSDEK